MTSKILGLFTLFSIAVFMTSCDDDNDTPCIETTWFEDADEDGLGNPDVLQTVENLGVSIDGIPLTGDPPSVTQGPPGMPGGGGSIPSIDPSGGHMDPAGYYHLHFVAEEMNNVFDAFGITEK